MLAQSRYSFISEERKREEVVAGNLRRVLRIEQDIVKNRKVRPSFS